MSAWLLQRLPRRRTVMGTHRGRAAFNEEGKFFGNFSPDLVTGLAGARLVRACIPG
jgi:hypothetical protein